MPGRITELSESQYVADLLKDRRRQAAATTSVQMPQPAKDTFTVAATPATTYTLNAIPYQGSGGSSLNLSLNGLELVEGVDYTVDYTTAIVTVSATLKGTPTPADVLTADYWTTGDLIALTGPVDTGGFSDTFNRADSTTSIGTASDGGTYTVDSTHGPTTFGIKSNAMYVVSGGDSLDMVRRNLGSVGVDASITTVTIGYSRSVITYAYDPATQNGYQLMFDGHVNKLTAGSTATLTGILPTPPYNLSTTGRVMRVVYNPATGDHSVYWDGVFKGTVNDPTPWTGANNTWVGVGMSQAWSLSGETLDNFVVISG